jgi:hypothetical protein
MSEGCGLRQNRTDSVYGCCNFESGSRHAVFQYPSHVLAGAYPVSRVIDPR